MAGIATFCSITAAISAFILLWQWAAGRRFKFSNAQINLPNHPNLGFTIFKPLKGTDTFSKDNLESYFRLDYPRDKFQILFGVASTSDPAFQLAQELISKYPQIDAKCIVCPDHSFANPKISTISQLQPYAKFDIYVLSDADVFVPPNLLKTLSSELANPNIGLVFCPYVITGPNSIPALIEKIPANADFWAQALLARAIGQKGFAFGALIAIRKTALDSFGGFPKIGNLLADDYYLGKFTQEAGFEVRPSSTVVECRIAYSNLKQVWIHQIRWARTIKSLQPLNYALSILSNTTLWALLLICTAPALGVLLSGILLMLLRVFVARDLSVKILKSSPSAIMTSRQGTTDLNPLHSGIDIRKETSWLITILAPIRDLLGVMLWVTAFLGNKVVWGDKIFLLGAGGKIIAEKKGKNDAAK